MQKLFALLTALLLILAAIPGLAEDGMHQLHLDVEFDRNIIMARYDVDVLVNGEAVAFIEHGQFLDTTVSVPEGMCTITFQKAGKPGVSVSTIIGVNRDTEVTCEIHANLKDLEFRSFQTNCTPDAYCLDKGETVDLDGIVLSVTSHRIADSYNGAFPAPGKVYVICQAEFRNNTSEDSTIVAVLSAMSFDVCCDDAETDAIWSAMYGLNGEISVGSLFSVLERLTQNSEVIRPGKKAIIELVFEVPEDWKVLEVYYAHKLIAAGEVIFIVNND